MKSFYIIVFNLLATITFAGFFCPEDVTITCDMDYTDTDMTGYPTTTGFNVQYPIKYIDNPQLNACGEGFVIRDWYQDLNSNNAIDVDEPYCPQKISLVALDNGDPIISFPSNVEYTCLYDITFQAPIIVAGPCDFVGYTFEDSEFILEEDACFKILREFVVIDWCVYDQTNGLSGLTNYTQVIKVIEKEAPEFLSCNDLTIPVGANCLAEVSLLASAQDVGDCPSSELYWTVAVDIGWDLVVDYEYSYYLTGNQFIEATANGESLEITLPDLIPIGTHGVRYTVRDACGNVSSCDQKIFIEDQKPPTPYCLVFVTASFDADVMPAMVPASLFDIGATDNCTSQEDITISFSEDPTDTVKVITCGNQGFQFFNIYATDESGNQDYCEAFMLIFDNDGCSFRYNPIGHVEDVYGNMLSNIEVRFSEGNEVMYTTHSAEEGYFQFEPTELNENYMLSVGMQSYKEAHIGLAEIKHVQDYLLGENTLLAPYQYVAADVNRDAKVNYLDVIAIKDHILGKTILPITSQYIYIEEESISEDWKSYKSSIPYMDYDGSFDILGISLNDMMVDLDESSESIEFHQETMGNNHSIQVSCYVSNSKVIDGMEYTIQLPKGLSPQEISVTSQQVELEIDDYYYDSNTGLLKYLNVSTLELVSNISFLDIRFSSGQQTFNAKTTITIINEDKIITGDIVEVANEKDSVLDGSFILKNNLIQSHLIINPNYYSANKVIMDISGNRIINIEPNVQNINVSSLSNGLYIIESSIDGIQKREKFIKI